MATTVARSYLLFYNSCQLALWSFTLLRILSTVLLSRLPWPHLPHDIYTASYPTLFAAQTLAWLEVVHAVLGLAGGGFAPTFIQCLGRYVVLAFVITPIPLAHSLSATSLLFLAWSIADVVRFTFYIVAALSSKPPFFLLWLRYSLFFILQPVGISTEWLVYFFTLSAIDDMRLYRVALPNLWNFAFDFGVWNRGVLVAYFYFGPFMIAHMFRQRRNKLRPRP